MIKLVTGSTGTAHVTAADDGALHAVMAGAGLVVFDTGSNFSATATSATEVRIEDGEGLIDGRHFRIAHGDSQTLNASAGTDGYNRKDLVVIHYKNNGGIESVALEVLEGAYSSDTAEDPTVPYSDASIIDGDAEVYVPLYRLTRSGINVPAIEPLFTAVDLSNRAPAEHMHGKITNDGKIAGVSAPMLLVTDASGNIIAETTITANITINGTLTASKVVGAVYA